MTVNNSDNSPEPVAGPANDLGVLISTLYRAFERELWQALAERGFADLGARHGSVLAHLRPEGVRAVELSRASGQHKQIVGTIVDELEALGYVERRPDPGDRRAKLVVPTERGIAQRAAAAEVITAYERRQTELLGPERFAQFRAALRELTDAARSAD
ncbi:MarR family winged helix-turn-helix transcriptional regulator [Streptacidiphilus jiangxiensis]|uniref:DNA-binding transcriptional regulator, MarR family n=1 Tax=Streptacidiphilus jiangxiensis TaxID=235985 RepID=A0A1H7VAF9_STRJI|nr:MarR family winged helix-turn-helix transcriptional regulator [Streptacidiphilus jiangxiensis]SEM06222.1 DNA-binding transcriptional regulator, MarR family [Streptacidiphilus jiangxiensis]